MSIEIDEKQSKPRRGYEHSRYENRRRILRFLLKNVGFNLLARIESVEGRENVPPSGSAIIMMNHIAFIDSIAVLTMAPRYLVPLAKKEVYDYPVIGIFPKIWGVIPVRREEVDRRAIQQALEVLRAGEIVLVAPEGTRGVELREGKEGIAYLASRGEAPIVPAAVEGTVGFPTYPFSRRWRGPGAQIRFGHPFRFAPELRHAGREQLRKMTDEAMYILASMLPPHRRGIYADSSQASQDTIEWL